jgi:hypothetical protein
MMNAKNLKEFFTTEAQRHRENKKREQFGDFLCVSVPLWCDAFKSFAWDANTVRIQTMANLTLVYGMRLLPSEDVAEVGQAPVKLTNGREAHVTMHVLEGSKEEIEKQLRTSLEAFFDLYPEI